MHPCPKASRLLRCTTFSKLVGEVVNGNTIILGIKETGNKNRLMGGRARR